VREFFAPAEELRPDFRRSSVTARAPFARPRAPRRTRAAAARRAAPPCARQPGVSGGAGAAQVSRAALPARAGLFGLRAALRRAARAHAAGEWGVRRAARAGLAAAVRALAARGRGARGGGAAGGGAEADGAGDGAVVADALPALLVAPRAAVPALDMRDPRQAREAEV